MDDRELLEKARGRLADLEKLQAGGLIPTDGMFFPSVHYPPITMYPPISEEEFLRGWRNPPEGAFVLYSHIPFCPSRCAFCHYPVTIGVNEGKQSDYLDLLAREMDLWLDRYGLPRFKARSVLIAGGTPSYLTPRLFQRFHDDFVKRVDMGSCTQISYDVHPTTLLGPEGAERLRIMRAHGSNRLTIGVQSFDPDLLARMNRHHTVQDSLDSIEACRKAGFDDICIEFIFGYPNQGMTSWLNDIRTAISTGVEEIQLYRLKIVPYGDAAGPVEREYRDHPDHFPDVHTALLMKQAAILLLAEHGYHENLTRVFTKEKKHISHYAQDQCCNLLDCQGFGLSAFSSLRDRFCINTDSLKEYAERVRAGRLPLNRGVVRTRDDNLRWHTVLPLKNMSVVRKDYLARMGVDIQEVFGPEIARLQEWGLVDPSSERKIRLTPLGRFFADEVCVQFHHPRYMPFPPEAYSGGPLYLSRPVNDTILDRATDPP